MSWKPTGRPTVRKQRGTSEIRRNGIREQVLGLLREPTLETSKSFSEVVRPARERSGTIR